MGRVMQYRIIWQTSLKLLAIALLTHSAGYGQSLGDVARENREQQQNAEGAPTTVKPRVITNKDLPKDADANQGSNPAAATAPASPSSTATDGPKAEHRSGEDRNAQQHSAQQHLAEQRAADQWKRQILAQKLKMATLQARIDRINASMRAAGGSVHYEPPYSPYQARQLQQVTQIQQQLDEQRRKLDEMQEAARRAGLHSAVYDP